MIGWRLLALAVALAPGVIAWWSGRRLILLLNDPALPERLLARKMRVVQAVAVALALIVVFMHKNALWTLPLAILSAIVGALAYGWVHLAALAGLCAVGGVALWLAFRRRRSELESRVDVFLPVAGLAVVMVAMWVILLRWAATEFGKVMPGMMVRARPDTWLAPLGIAGALFTVRHRAARWGGVAALAASFLLHAVGAGWLSGWLLAR